MSFVKVRKSDKLIVSISTTAQAPDVNEFLEIETEQVFNSNNDYFYNLTDSTFIDVGTKPEIVKPTAQLVNPFGAKKIIVGGVEKCLYARLTGISQQVMMNVDTNIDYAVGYSSCKIIGLEIMGCHKVDKCDLLVLDTDNNDISGLDVGTYGANVQLNQFGFNVNISENSYYHEAKYDADLVSGMILRVVYKEKNGMTKTVGVNFDLHEVK